jgi:hypothetical protein
MPQKTKAEIQAELAVIMEALLGASAALDEDIDPASDQEISAIAYVWNGNAATVPA